MKQFYIEWGVGETIGNAVIESESSDEAYNQAQKMLNRLIDECKYTTVQEYMPEKDKCIVEFYQYCWGMGELEGMFVCYKADLDRVKDVEVYLSDVLGKHSEIDVHVGSTCSILTEESTEVALVEKILGEGFCNGINIVDYALDYLEDCE